VAGGFGAHINAHVKSREMTKLTNGTVSFGLIPKEHWVQPAWIDEDLARAGRNKMVEQGIIYAGSVPYIYSLWTRRPHLIRPLAIATCAGTEHSSE
jgi:hypothetical protein